MPHKQRCIIHGCRNAQGRRGLCEKHYQQFRRARERIPREHWPAFEARLIRSGKLLPDGRAASEDNAFAGEAEEFLCEISEAMRTTTTTPPPESLRVRRPPAEEAAALHELAEGVETEQPAEAADDKTRKKRTERAASRGAGPEKTAKGGGRERRNNT